MFFCLFFTTESQTHPIASRRSSKHRFPRTIHSEKHQDIEPLSNEKTDRFLATFLRNRPASSAIGHRLYDEQMQNLRRVYKKLKRNRTYALRNFDEFLAAASLYHFRKISSLPAVYRTGIQEIDEANTAKLRYYKIYEPNVSADSSLINK